MPFDREATIQSSIEQITRVLTQKPDWFPSEQSLGQWGVGAMAVGFNADEATEASRLLAVSESSDKTIGGSMYLAGAVFAQELAELEHPSREIGLDASVEPRIFDPKLLARCSEYICQFLGYERPRVSAEDKGPFSYPAIIPELYQQLHDSLIDREKPVSDETLAAYGFRAIYESVNSNGAKNPDELLQNSIDDQDEADCITLFGGAK